MAKDIADTPEVPILGSDWFDPLEAGVRQQFRLLIEGLWEEELTAALKRVCYARSAGVAGHRNGHRDRAVLGTFGAVTVPVPQARVADADGQSAEWRSQGLPAYQRLTRRAEALLAGTYLAKTNTRRVRRALGTLFEGAVGKNTVSRVWHKVQADWQAWQKRSLANDDIVRLILDGTVGDATQLLDIIDEKRRMSSETPHPPRHTQRGLGSKFLPAIEWGCPQQRAGIFVLRLPVCRVAEAY